jgi:acyl carrier protein
MKIDKKKILQIVSKHTKVQLKTIKENSSTDNIQTWDSLAHIRIILELQKLTNIKIPTSSFGQFNSIKTLNKKFKK